MAKILIRNIPREVLDKFKRMAKSNNRTLQQELRNTLENIASQSSQDIFQTALTLKKKLERKAIRFTDSAKLLRRQGPRGLLISALKKSERSRMKDA
jgi:plasmid stability protein